MKESDKARVDIRLSASQKALVEQAVLLGGFKTTTEFVLYSINMEAERIIDKHTAILSSRKDQEIFFEALRTPPAPNGKLKQAAKRYLKALR